jgi:gentisate 1,2-dioxygenase
MDGLICPSSTISTPDLPNAIRAVEQPVTEQGDSYAVRREPDAAELQRRGVVAHFQLSVLRSEKSSTICTGETADPCHEMPIKFQNPATGGYAMPSISTLFDSPKGFKRSVPVTMPRFL